LLHFLLQQVPSVDVYNAYKASYCCVGIAQGGGDDVRPCVGIGIVGLCDGLNVGDDDGIGIVGLCDGLNVGGVVGIDSRLTDLIDDVNGTVNNNISTINILYRCIDSSSSRNKNVIINQKN